MTSADQKSSPWEEPRSDEVEFFIVDKEILTADDRDDLSRPKSPERRNIGTLVEPSSSGTGMMTSIPLQPGDIVQLNQAGTLRLGVVMWSVESSNSFRVQMRFV